MPWPAEAAIDFAGAGDNTIVVGVADQKVRVFQLFFVVAAATIIVVKDGAGTALTGPMSFTAGGSFVLDFVRGSREADQPWFTTSEGNAFVLNSTNAVQVSGRVYYTQGHGA